MHLSFNSLYCRTICLPALNFARKMEKDKSGGEKTAGAVDSFMKETLLPLLETAQVKFNTRTYTVTHSNAKEETLPGQLKKGGLSFGVMVGAFAATSALFAFAGKRPMIFAGVATALTGVYLSRTSRSE